MHIHVPGIPVYYFVSNAFCSCFSHKIAFVFFRLQVSFIELYTGITAVSDDKLK